MPNAAPSEINPLASVNNFICPNTAIGIANADIAKVNAKSVRAAPAILSPLIARKAITREPITIVIVVNPCVKTVGFIVPNNLIAR